VSATRNCAPPTPPPPGVEQFKETEAGHKAQTGRDRLEAHRTNKSCNACHGVIDPLGLAMENFDVIGAWRTKDSGLPVNATATLAGGASVDGVNQLNDYLLSRPDQFVQTLTTKLMIYATGRPMEWQDMPTIRAIVKQAAADDYRFATLVALIVKSAPFRMKQVPVEARTPETRQASLVN
jgi:hypothetical protein